MKSSASPSWPFEIPTASCTLGTDDAHAPQSNPSAPNAQRTGVLVGIPAGGQLRGLPALRLAPVLPAGRERPLGDHALALGADRVRLRGRVPAVRDRRLQLVLVLPAPVPARL